MKIYKSNKNFNILFFYFFVIFSILFIFFNQSFLFLNEEFLVGLCVLIFLFIIFYLSKKMLNFSFFFKAEAIYLSLIYLSRLVFLFNKKINFLFQTSFLNNIYFSRFQIYSLFLSISEIFSSLLHKIYLNFSFTHFVLTYLFCILFSNFYILDNNLLSTFNFSDEEIIFEENALSDTDEEDS